MSAAAAANADISSRAREESIACLPPSCLLVSAVRPKTAGKDSLSVKERSVCHRYQSAHGQTQRRSSRQRGREDGFDPGGQGSVRHSAGRHHQRVAPTAPRPPSSDFLPPNGETEKKGMYALEQADLFNLLASRPTMQPTRHLDSMHLMSAAAAYCEKRRAMLLVDAPKNWKDKTTPKQIHRSRRGLCRNSQRKRGAIFPASRKPNPLRDNQMENFAPAASWPAFLPHRRSVSRCMESASRLKCDPDRRAAVAGEIDRPRKRRTQPTRHQLPARLPCDGRVVWGARTLRRADSASTNGNTSRSAARAVHRREPVSRHKWVVFEPNDEPLWAQIRLNVGAFMHDLFRQGAFQGTTPREAYFVKCDKETTTAERHQPGHREHRRRLCAAQAGRVRRSSSSSRWPGTI